MSGLDAREHGLGIWFAAVAMLRSRPRRVSLVLEIGRLGAASAPIAEVPPRCIARKWKTGWPIAPAGVMVLVMLVGCSAIPRGISGVFGPSVEPRGGHKLLLKASWYGRDFEGRRTASGQRFDSTAYTAAHPTLAFGTVLRVTNPENGASVLVTVNDRGPFVRGRHIDLSYAAARRLGIVSTGVTAVEVETVRTGPTRRHRGISSAGVLGE